MTEEQLEIAARKYCELTGQNADDLVEGPVVPSISVPRWRTYVPRIKQLWVVQEAILYALKMP